VQVTRKSVKFILKTKRRPSPLPEVFSWVNAMAVCLPTVLRFRGLRNSLAILATLTNSDLHWRWHSSPSAEGFAVARPLCRVCCWCPGMQMSWSITPIKVWPENFHLDVSEHVRWRCSAARCSYYFVSWSARI